MKKALLIKAGMLTALSAVTVGTTVAPAFAADASGEAGTVRHGSAHRPRLHMIGPVGIVTAVTQNGDGTGTVTMTLEARPEALRPDGAAADHIRERIEQFREEHPDAPKAGDSVTVNYTAETKIMINGEESSAANLAVGTKVRVLGARFNEEAVAKIITTDIKPPMMNHVQRGIRAVIESVDAAANSFKILLPAHGDHEEQVVRVDYSDETVFQNGREDATESDLTAGARVHIGGELSVEDGEVRIDNVTKVIILQ